jgi:hypothetical protein
MFLLSLFVVSFATALVGALICANIASNGHPSLVCWLHGRCWLSLHSLSGQCSYRFVATVHELVCRLVLVLTYGTAACVLLVCVGRFHQRLEVLFGKLVVGLGGSGLLLPIEHFVFVKMVAVIHFLQVKLEFVFVRDCYDGADKCTLVVVKALSKGGEMFVKICSAKEGFYPGFLNSQN